MATGAKLLTEAGVTKAKPGKARREIPDGAGLYLVVQPTGAKSWAVRYRRDGMTRKHTIGPYPGIGLKAARELAKGAVEAVAKGADPAADKRSARLTAADTSTELRFVMPTFLARYVTSKKQRPRPRTLEELGRLLGLRTKGGDWQVIGGGIADRWGKRKVNQITRADILGLLDEIIESGKSVKANRTLAALHQFFGWCVRREMIAENPCARVDRPAAEQSRSRVMTDAELRWFWQATTEDVRFGPLFRFLLLTAQRRDEARRMTYRDLDMEAKTWTIPAAVAKNGREHQVPLSEAALAILKAQRRIKGNPGLVFTTTGETPLSGLSRAKARVEAEMLRLARQEYPEATIERWTLHDLRRSAATGMARLGVDIPLIEKVLNHSGGTFGGIVGVYQHHDFAAEKRAALTRWARNVEAIVNGTSASVVELRGAANG